MEILYNYKPYTIPRSGFFLVETGEYRLPKGWIQKAVKETIIGETDNDFVTELIESGYGEWVGDKVIQHQYILPIGYHKSRLFKWDDYLQLKLSL